MPIDPAQLTNRIQEEVGVSSQFMGAIYSKDDDWSMVIKLAALLEATTSLAIQRELGRDGLSSFVDSLPMRGERGKLGLAKSLGLLDQRTHAYLDELFRMRNSFAHDPRNAGMSIAQYLSNLTSEQRINCEKRLYPIDTLERPTEGRPGFPPELAPKMNVWVSSMLVLIQLGKKFSDPGDKHSPST